MNAGEVLLSAPARVVFLLLEGAVLLLNVVGLPANWILLGLALAWALVTDLQRLGWIALAILAGLAVLGEILELLVGMAYTAKRGATRRGVLGGFVGGLAGAVLAAPVAPPAGSLAGALAGSFAGAVLFEYLGDRQLPRALRAGRAAFVGRALASLVKSTCGFWMWVVLAYRLLGPR